MSRESEVDGKGLVYRTGSCCCHTHLNGQATKLITIQQLQLGVGP